MGIMLTFYPDRMFRQLGLPMLLMFPSAMAGGAARSPLGVPDTATRTLYCQSGRDIPTFSPNTQSIRLLYRGKLQVLMFVPGLPTENRVGPVYSQLARPGDGTFNLPGVGTGLELILIPENLKRLYPVELYRVTQDSAGTRRYTLLDKCRW